MTAYGRATVKSSLHLAMEIFLIVVFAFIVIPLYGRVGQLEKTVEKLRRPPGVHPSAVVPLPPAAGPHPIPAPTPAVSEEPPTQFAEAPARESKSTEFTIGSEWFLGAGAIAVLLGIGFFFRYAFANNLISEPVRIMLGVAFGLVLIGIGHWLKEKYRSYGLTLVGLGLGVIYISFYAAYALYSLLPAFPSFVVVVLVAFIGVALALLYDAKQLAAVALAGGYVSIFLYIGALSVTGGFATLLLLAFLVVFASYFRKWPEIVTAGLVFTTLALYSWTAVNTVSLSIVIPLVSILYGIFTLSTLFNFSASQNEYTTWQSFNLYATPFAFFVYLSPLLNSNENSGLLAFGVAAAYGLMGIVVHAFTDGNIALKKFAEMAMLIAPAFLAIGFAYYFEGDTRVILLAIEGALVVISALTFDNRFQYYLGQFLLIVGLFGALIYAATTSPDGPLVFNGRTLTLALSAISLGAAWGAHLWRSPTYDKETVRTFRVIDAVLFYLMTLAAVLFEVHRLTLATQEFLAADVVALALVTIGMYALGVSAREAALRYVGYGALGIASLLSIIAAAFSGDHIIFFNLYIGSALATAALAAVMYATLKTESDFADEFVAVRQVLLVCANAVIILVFTFEIQTYYRLSALGGNDFMERFSISVFWLLYGILGLLLGIARRSTFSRQLAILLFALTTLKVFLYDSLQLSDLYRFFSFITLGLILLVVGYLYFRFKSRIHSFVGLQADTPTPAPAPATYSPQPSQTEGL